MPRKLLFIDRDGTLIEEPDDFQVDALEKIRLVEGVIPALRRLVDAGYELVLVSNQDGLGTSGYPRAAFEQVQQFLYAMFASQGITFASTRICPHVADDHCDCRKPRPGLVLDFLREGFDRSHSAVIGDRDTDLQLAQALGVQGFKLKGFEGAGLTWADIARRLLDAPRRARVERNTRETRIIVAVDLDDGGEQQIDTGIGFLDHMLESFSRHAGFSLQLECQGDLEVDAHHTVEDCALVLGQALNDALGDRRGLERFGFVLPMDESRAAASVDLGGRPFLEFSGKFPRDSVGALPTEMVPHFFRSLCETLRMNLHIEVRGENTHHMVEACFKVVARALRQALSRDGQSRLLPSTKGLL